MASIKIKNSAYTEGGIEPKWLTIPMYAKMNPFEVLNITLMSNIPAPDRSMYGADITVVTADGVKILDTDWYGQPITLNIDEGVTYTVTVSVSDCYTAQEEQSFTFTAASNNIRNLNIHYKANGIKVNMLTTAGASINKPATITYMSGDNEESVEVFHGKIAALPLGVEATITFPQVDGFDIPEPYTFTVTKDTVEYTATYSITGITKIRINNNITDPESIIELIEDTGGIEKIRANSHLYTGEVVDGVMQLKQLNDNTGNTYLDGTIATIDVPGIDVWMKLPQFWYKVEEYYTDIYDVSFSVSKIDDTWNEWDGKDLIGAYFCRLSDDNQYMYSYYKDMAFFGGIDISTAKEAAANRGDGFRITQYKHHCIMQWLCFAFYKNVKQDCSNTFYKNTNIYSGGSNTYIYGDTIITMKDYVRDYTSGGNVQLIANLWGLQNWVCGQPEYLGNVTIQNGNMLIINDDNSETIIPYNKSGFLKKLMPTENLLSIHYDVSAGSTSSFCSRIQYSSSNGYVGRGAASWQTGDMGYTECHLSSSISTLTTLNGSTYIRYSDHKSDGSNYYYREYYNKARLTYRGDWVIID